MAQKLVEGHPKMVGIAPEGFIGAFDRHFREILQSTRGPSFSEMAAARALWRGVCELLGGERDPRSGEWAVPAPSPGGMGTLSTEAVARIEYLVSEVGSLWKRIERFDTFHLDTAGKIQRLQENLEGRPGFPVQEVHITGMEHVQAQLSQVTEALEKTPKPSQFAQLEKTLEEHIKIGVLAQERIEKLEKMVVTLQGQINGLKGAAAAARKREGVQE